MRHGEAGTRLYRTDRLVAVTAFRKFATTAGVIWITPRREYEISASAMNYREAENVSQAWARPVSKPVLNQRMRCAEVP